MNGGGRRQERIAKEENAECGMAERERKRESKREREEGVLSFSLSLPPSPARTREGRREAKEDEEYGKGGFAGKTLHGEGG